MFSIASCLLPPLGFFSFFSDWARHSRLYTMSSKNCDVCTLLMRVRGRWRKWRDIETTIWCWWWIKTRQTSVQVSGAGMKSSFWYGKPHFIALFFVLPLFCLSFYYSYEAYGPIAPSNAYTTESEWCENFLDMPTNKQASCLLTTFALARAVEKATTATTALGKVLIKLYDEMMEISRVVKSRLATVKTQICEYPWVSLKNCLNCV